MKTARSFLLCLLIAHLLPAAANAEDFSSPRGFTTSLDLGVNFLVPPTKNKTPYKQFDPSFGMALGLGYRFSDLFALRFPFTFGM